MSRTYIDIAEAHVERLDQWPNHEYQEADDERSYEKVARYRLSLLKSDIFLALNLSHFTVSLLYYHIVARGNIYSACAVIIKSRVDIHLGAVGILGDRYL